MGQTSSSAVPEPLVSVCLPVFNGEHYLAEAVRSILAQTHRNFELLIFDDASTDASWPLLNTFHDPRLVLHRNDRNRGPERNWNQAMAAAKGRYIKLFHQDDLLAPDCLARQVEALEGAPEAVLTFCSRNIIRSNGTRLMSRAASWPEGLIAAPDLVRECVKAGTNLIGEPSAVLFRRESAARTGGFDGSIPYLIDLDYWVRLMEHGSAYCMKLPLASFRISSHQWSVAIGRQQSQQFIAFMDRLTDMDRFHLGLLIQLRGRLMARMNGLLRAMMYYLVVRDSR